MPVFPELGPAFINAPDQEILSIMEKNYAESVMMNQSYWGEASVDARFEAGDQTLWNDAWFGNIPMNRRQVFNFNHIRPTINMIDGFQRRNRKSTIVVPIENGNSDTADQLTKTLMWTYSQDNIHETFSDAFRGALITGMNLLHVWLDFRDDPISGNIRVTNCSYNSFLVDPFFKRMDLSDCNFIWKRSFLTKRECISLMPHKAQEIMALSGNDNNRDGKFQFMAETYNYGIKNLLSYDEYYYRDYRTQKMLVDTRTGECFEWKSSDEKKLKVFLDAYPEIELIENTIPTVNLAIVIQGYVAYDGPNLVGTDVYPIVPIFSYYAPELPYFEWRVAGVVRGLRDSQYIYNRRKLIELDVLESQINSGIKMKENSLVNPKDAFKGGQGQVLVLKQEAQMTDVERFPAPDIPPSFFTLSESFSNEIFKISGVNEELMGAASDDKAGILSMLRQGAGLTTLQLLFDRADLAQRLLGRLILEIIQTNFTPGKVQNILQEKPTDFFYKKEFGRYDCSVEEGILTQTQKQMQFAQLLQLREAGVEIPQHVLVDAATLQNKKQLVEAIQQQQQQMAQMQQQQSQVQMQQLQAQTELAQARAQADRGLGLERMSRIQENEALAVERRAEAEKDEELAFLNKVKAIKEIESIDIAQLDKLVALARLINAQNLTPAEQSAPGS